MNKGLLIAFLLLLAYAQDEVLSSSGSSTAEIDSGSSSTSQLPSSASTSTSGIRSSTLAYTSAPSKPTSWSFLNSNTLGQGSKWVSSDGSFAEKPIGYVTKYTITFYVDCPQNPVTLYYASTGYSYVNLNGNWVHVGGYPYPSTHKVSLSQPNLKCGCNKLTIYVYNYWWSSPLAIIYYLSQNTAGCYNCTNLGVTFYNKETCQCECANKPCDCDNKAKTWFDYPSCGCACSKSLICPTNKYFNRQKCSCDCSPKCCPAGYYQDPVTCGCKKQVYCLIVRDCKVGYYWDNQKCDCVSNCPAYTSCLSGMTVNPDTCQCQCASVQRCNAPQTWNSTSCKCTCPYQGYCIQPYGWNSDTCSCECQIICIATMTVDTQNCRCVPLTYTTNFRTIQNSGIQTLDSTLSVSGGGR